MFRCFGGLIMRFFVAATGAFVVGLFSLSPLLAKPGDASRPADEALDRSPLNCLSLRRIRRTEVVDDRTVLFYTRGNGIYENLLQANCPGLKRNRRFVYATDVSRICQSDSITVVRGVSSQINGGLSCQLGTYHPLSKLEAAQLVDAAKYNRSIRSYVNVKPVEVPSEADSQAPGATIESVTEETTPVTRH